MSHRGTFSSSVSAPPHMLTPERGMKDVVNTAGWHACACFFHKQHKHGLNGKNDTNKAEGPAFPSCAGTKTTHLESNKKNHVNRQKPEEG